MLQSARELLNDPNHLANKYVKACFADRNSNISCLSADENSVKSFNTIYEFERCVQLFQDDSPHYKKAWQQLELNKKSDGHIVSNSNGEASFSATVVNLKGIDKSIWETQPNLVYIGRGNSKEGIQDSKWANKTPPNDDVTLEQSLEMYEKSIKDSPLAEQLGELRGKILGCWCFPNRCHGDILLKLIGE